MNAYELSARTKPVTEDEIIDALSALPGARREAVLEICGGIHRALMRRDAENVKDTLAAAAAWFKAAADVQVRIGSMGAGSSPASPSAAWASHHSDPSEPSGSGRPADQAPFNADDEMAF